MIAAIVVRLPFCTRPVALPVLARLVHKDLTPAPASRLMLARQMTAALAAALPGTSTSWPTTPTRAKNWPACPRQ